MPNVQWIYVCGQSSLKGKEKFREEKYRQTTRNELDSGSISARMFGMRLENYMYQPYEEGSNFSCVLIHCR